MVPRVNRYANQVIMVEMCEPSGRSMHIGSHDGGAATWLGHRPGVDID